MNLFMNLCAYMDIGYMLFTDIVIIVMSELGNQFDKHDVCGIKFPRQYGIILY